jgi:hypothetical protein
MLLAESIRVTANYFAACLRYHPKMAPAARVWQAQSTSQLLTLSTIMLTIISWLGDNFESRGKLLP